MNTRFAQYLKSLGYPVYEAGGTYWVNSGGKLIPSPSNQVYVELDEKEAKNLLKESGAHLLFYSSNPCDHETEWWNIICDSYDPSNLKPKVRNAIKRGLRECTVKIIDAQWLAENGYSCYYSAYSRHENASPISEKEFYDDAIERAKGPYEYWGVFVKDELAAYSQCIIEDTSAYINMNKYNPEYFKYYTSYALVTSMIKHYVVGLGMTISNGSRTLLHDTNYNDLLVKLGFRKQYCKLNVIYSPMVNLGISMLFPFKRIINKLPNHRYLYLINSLLFLEQLRRNF